jgi:hypothetical protein
MAWCRPEALGSPTTPGLALDLTATVAGSWSAATDRRSDLRQAHEHASVTVPGEQAAGRPGETSKSGLPQNTGPIREGRRGGGPLAPDLDPGLDQRLVYPRGDAQVGDLPVPGGVALVLPIAQGEASAP